MSIRTVARFVLKALAASLLKEVDKHNREMGKALKAHTSKMVALNDEIKELSYNEKPRIAEVRAKAEAEVSRIKAELHAKITEEHTHIKECEQFCKHSKAKVEKAVAMRAKVLAIVE